MMNKQMTMQEKPSADREETTWERVAPDEIKIGDYVKVANGDLVIENVVGIDMDGDLYVTCRACGHPLSVTVDEEPVNEHLEWWRRTVVTPLTEPQQPGLYLSQSGKPFMRNDESDPEDALWMCWDGSLMEWADLVNSLPKAEFPFRPAKAMPVAQS
jgi:hypothetical protein